MVHFITFTTHNDGADLRYIRTLSLFTENDTGNSVSTPSSAHIPIYTLYNSFLFARYLFLSSIPVTDKLMSFPPIYVYKYITSKLEGEDMRCMLGEI